MDTRKEKTWVQCLDCGHIYIVDKYISIENLIVKLSCPKCRHEKGLNCGYDEMDAMELKDPYLDERYFIYETIQNE